MNKNNYSLKAQAGYLFSGRLAALILQFILPIILVRIFSKDDYGLYRQVMLISMFFVPSLRFGMANSLFFFYPNAKERVSQLLSQTFYFSISVGILFLPLFYLCRYPIAHFFKNDALIKLIYPCGLYIFFFLISFILEYIFILEKKSKLVFSYVILDQTIRISLILISLMIFRTVNAIIWALVIFSAIRTFVLYAYLRMNYKVPIRNWDKHYFFSQITYAFPMGMGKIIGEVGRIFDKFILSAFLSSSDFAVYSIANFRIPFINILYTSIGNVVLPQVSKCSEKNNFQEAKRLWHKMIVGYSLVTIPMIFFFNNGISSYYFPLY